MSYWLGLRARIVNPHNPHAGQIGTIVTEPDGQRLIIVRLDDGAHVLVGAWTVQIERAAEGIEPT